MSTGYGLGFPNQQFFDNTGDPLSGGKVYTYAAGTSTPQTTYTDSALTVPNANPIILDSAGRCVIYLPTNTGYKFVINTSADVTVLTQDNVSLISVATPPAPAAVPTGAILAYGAVTAPSGYVLCDGSAIDRTVYAALFAVLSTTYGAGDGSTTFNVPDMRQRFVLGKAASGTGAALGATGGAIDHTHTGPSHTHTYSDTTSTPSATQGDAQAGSGSAPASGTHTHTSSGTTAASGTGATGSNNGPFVVCVWIVKT
jgi:microcystin-dependent protein